jgi:predicted CxxxxCH...CXXCH cytochrome family protein
MGKVINNKLQGMSLRMKVCLVLLVTVISSVFMYEGWYAPKAGNTVAVTRNFQQSTGTSVGIDGSTNWVTNATTIPIRNLMDSTIPTTSAFTASALTTTPTIIYNAYSPAITANTTIAAGATVSLRLAEATAVTTTETFTANLYDYTPGGIAGNGTLIGTATVTNSTLSGTSTAVALTLNNTSYSLTASAGTPKQLKLVVLASATAAVTLRTYTGTGTSSSLTTDETTVALPTVQFSAASSTGPETTSPAAIGVTLSAVSTNPVTVNYATTAGTATAGLDYTTTSGTLTIPAGSTTGTINVPILTDALTESAETFTITLSAPGNATLGAQTTHTRTITDSAPLVSTITACNGCHGNPPVDGSVRNTPTGQFPGTHNVHAGSTATAGQYGFACTTCHYNNTAFDHSSGYMNITGSRLPGNAYLGGKKKLSSNTSSLFACTNLYCHSQGTGGTSQAGDARAVSAPNATATWGGTGDCSLCHTGGTATGPTYTNGAPKTNSHNAHVVTNTYTCDICHYATTQNGTTIATVANHNNRIYDVTPNTTKGASFTYTYASTGGTCKSSACHGGAAVSLAWGANLGTIQCFKCHGDRTAASMANFSASTVAPGGSGRDLAGNTASTSPRVGAHQQHLLGQSKMSYPIHCGECHTVHTTVKDATHLNYTTATITFGPLARSNANNAAPSVTRTAGVMTCNNTYCHLGGLRASGAAAGQRGSVTFPTWTFNASPLDNTTIAGTCTSKCHAMPPGMLSTGSVVAGDTHAGLTTPVTIQDLAKCSSLNNGLAGTGCHPTLKSRAVNSASFTNMTSIFINKGALHINGVVEGGSCMGCHKDVKGARRDVANDFTDPGNSHHFQSASAVDGKVCYACHWEAKADGSKDDAYHTGNSTGVVDLVIWNTTSRPTVNTANVTSTTYLSGGAAASARTEIAKINNHCLGCHNVTNNTTAPFSAAGDSSTPSKYSWEALSTTKGGLGATTATSIAAKYSDTATTTWGKFTGNYTNNKNQVKAYSAHGNASVNQRGWSTLIENAQGAAVVNYPNTSAANPVLCFDCHNSHGSEAGASPANAVTTSYSSATGRGKGGLLKTTVAAQGGYVASYKPYSGGNFAQKNVYKAGAGLCFDCHNNAASAATSTGFTSPWGYQTPFGATQKIHGYNDNPYFGKAGGAFARGVTYTYLSGLTNKGGHFGASYPLTTATTNGMKIGGLCTPCHDPHGVSPNLPNRPYSVPMLKESFVTSPYKMDAAAVNTPHGGGRNVSAQSQSANSGYHIDQNTFQAATTGKPAAALKWNFATSATTLQTLTDTQFAGLCIKCHAKTAINNTAPASSTNWKSMSRIHNSVKGWASTGGGNAGNVKHAYTCSKCHSTHNSNLPRLLVTNCLDARHKNRSATVVTPSATTIGPFTGSASSGNGLGRFPGGGAAAKTGSRSSSPGPWMFATSGTAATQACHDSTTAGGTFDAAGTSQQWNTKSLW